MMNETITTLHLRKRMNWEAHTRSRVTTTFLNSPRPNTMRNQNKTPEWSTFICKIGFLHRRTSIINTRCLKPIIKLFDSEWSYMLDLFFKLISLLVIWSCNCNNATKKKITHLGTSIVQVCPSTLNRIPQWISKPRIRKPKNHCKSSSGVGRSAQNLGASKKLLYNVQMSWATIQTHFYQHSIKWFEG